MHDYLFNSEIVRFAFVFGICVSMMLYERLHLTTGSIVVPGYIAVFLIYPMVVVATFVNALLSYALMNHVIRKRFILYGRAKFTLMALISISIQTIMLKTTPSGAWLWEKNFPLFVGAGYVVPSLIAHDMGRQGIKRTSKAVMLSGVIVFSPIMLALLLHVKGINDLAPLSGFGTMSIVSRWIPFAVLLSAAAAWGVATNYNLKSGGFVGAAYVGMFMGDPYQVAVTFVVAFITFVIVRYILMRNLILFGRRKFSSMLLTSSMISWTLLWIGQSVFSARVTNHMDLGSLALTPLFVPGLLANDMDRTSPLRVVLGTGIGAAFVVPATWWAQSVIEGSPLEWSWKLLTIGAFLLIFWKTIRQLVRYERAQFAAKKEAKAAKVARLAAEEANAAETAAGDTGDNDDAGTGEPVWTPALVPAAASDDAPAPAAAAAKMAPELKPDPDTTTWPYVERRKATRPWTRKPLEVVFTKREDRMAWAELAPQVRSISEPSWGKRGTAQWSEANVDAWDDAEDWLNSALRDPLLVTAQRSDEQVA